MNRNLGCGFIIVTFLIIIIILTGISNQFIKSSYIDAIAFSQKGNLTFYGRKSLLILCDIYNKKIINYFKVHKSKINHIKFSHDESMILTTDSYEIKLWDINTNNILKSFYCKDDSFNFELNNLAFSLDNRYISYLINNKVKILDIQSGSILKTIKDSDNLTSIVYFTDNNKIFVGGGTIFGQGLLHLWDIENNRIIKKFEGHSSLVQCLAISHDNKFIISGSRDRTIKLWDALNGTLIKTFTGHNDIVTSLVFSADDKFIISGSRDRTIKLWDALNGTLIKTFQGHKDWIVNVSFSADNKYILSGDRNSIIKLWNIEIGEVNSLSDYDFLRYYNKRKSY